MKREVRLLSIFLSSIFFISFMIGIVAAADGSGFAGALTNFIDGVQQVGEPLFGALFGNYATTSELFIQVLAFLLVVLVIYGLLDTMGIFGNKGWVNFLIGVVIAVLGIRFLPQGFLQEAAIPSSALVALLVMGVPFILVGFLIQKIESTIARRALWVAYGVIILILWIYNLDNTYLSATAKWIYPAILIGCIIAFWFDGTLQKWLHKAQAERTVESTTNVQMGRVIAEIRDLQGAVASTTGAQQERYKKLLEQKKKALGKF